MGRDGVLKYDDNDRDRLQWEAHSRVRAGLSKRGAIFRPVTPSLFFSFVFLALLNLLQAALVKAVPVKLLGMSKGFNRQPTALQLLLVAAADDSAHTGLFRNLVLMLNELGLTSGSLVLTKHFPNC